MAHQHEALYQACFALARITHWKTEPVAVSQIESFAQKLLAEALSQVASIETLGGSEEQVVRAVRYIEQAHAIPPIGDNIDWFRDTLQALMEIVFPNTELDGAALDFLFDLQSGITSVLRSRLKANV